MGLLPNNITANQSTKGFVSHEETVNGQGEQFVVTCNGNELELSSCQITQAIGEQCTHNEDVGIYCLRGSSNPYAKVRIVNSLGETIAGGRSTVEGRLEVW
jgi:hypothetical protein